jgi:acyl carrier protein
MKNETEVRAALRAWIVEKNGRIRPEELADDTPLVAQRLITSVQIMDLILFLERLSDQPIRPETLKPGVFQDINTLVASFFPNLESSDVERP